MLINLHSVQIELFQFVRHPNLRGDYSAVAVLMTHYELTGIVD